MPTNLVFIAKVKGVKADIVKKEITFSFITDMDEQTMANADELTFFAGKDAGDVEVKVLPRQQKLFKDGE